MIEKFPVWIRLPVEEYDSDGRVTRRAFCEFTGISRSKLVRFAAAVRFISVEEDQADESAGEEFPAATKKRKWRFVRLIRLRGPSPAPNRMALLDYLDNLALEQARLNRGPSPT